MKSLNEFSSLLVMGAVVLGVCVGVGTLLPGNATSGSDEAVPIAAASELTAQGGADAADRRTRPICVECGIVESTRGIAPPGASPDQVAVGATKRARRQARVEQPIDSYEVLVRMEDGSNRRFTHAPPANWRVGERLILIAGKASQ